MEYNYPKFTPEMKQTHTILIPNMAITQFRLLEYALRYDGYKCEILGNCGSAVAQLGLKYVHNDTCYPALLVIGQFLDALNSGKYDLDHTVLLITQTGGGCRASNYIHLLRKALVKAGYPQIPVASLNFSGLEKDSGFQMTLPLARRALACIFYGDMLCALRNQVAPYENEKGAADRMVDLWVERLGRVLLAGNGNLALRYYNDVVKGKDVSAEYAGYAAQNPVVELPNYLGTVADLHKILESTRITHIVIAEETQNRSELLQITAIAENYGIKVSVIPVYSDFLSSRTMDNTVNGLYVIDLKMQETCDIMGVNIVVTDMDKTMTLLESQLEQWRGKYICVANVHTTVTAHEDAEYRYIQNHAVMALPDGGPLSQFSRRQGYAAAQRVTGPDLMKQVLAVSAEKGWRHYFYGSTPETLQLLRKKVEERYPGVVISGMMSPPFREMTPQEDAQAVAEINATKPDFVWVGLGAPKQERWMAAHEDRVQALMIGVGAAFDYEAGNIKRAPMWMQKHNLEWLYRLMQDPKRLFHRYLKTNVKYLLWTWRSGE